MINWEQTAFIFYMCFCFVSVSCRLIGSENNVLAVPTCSEICDTAGSTCINPSSSKDYCHDRAKIYCNTDIMKEVTDEWVHYHDACVYDFCYVDCTKHIYYQPSRIVTCDQNRDGIDDCQYPNLEEVMCECDDVVVDYSFDQFLTFRVKRGLVLFVTMVLLFYLCQAMSRFKKQNIDDDNESESVGLESQRGLLASRHEDFEAYKHSGGGNGDGVEMGTRSDHGVSKRSPRHGPASSDSLGSSSAHGAGKGGQKTLVSHKKITPSSSMASTHQKRQSPTESSVPNPSRESGAMAPGFSEASGINAGPIFPAPSITTYSRNLLESGPAIDSHEHATTAQASHVHDIDDGDKVASLKRRAERLERLRKGESVS